MTDLQIMNEHSAMMNDKNRDGEIMTGTTIMALPFDGGVVVCADSRTSTGTYVANRVSDKLVQISEKIYCCRSGSAADTQALTDYVHYFLNQWWYVKMMMCYDDEIGYIPIHIHIPSSHKLPIVTLASCFLLLSFYAF
jgi:hypothetical protein